MRSRILTLTIVGMFVGSLSAYAQPVPSIIGTWQGTHENLDPTSGKYLQVNPMSFVVQSQSGTAISGYFDWLTGASAGCPSSPCTTTWSGTIDSSGDLAFGGQFGDKYLAGLTTGNTLTGTFTAPASNPDFGYGNWSATLVQAPEIDPASAASALTLLLGGLAVLRGRRTQVRAGSASAFGLGSQLGRSV
jgi:hypothetical protein